MTRRWTAIAASSPTIWLAIFLVVVLDTAWLKLAGISADPVGIVVLAAAVGILVAIALFYYHTRRADPIMRAANSAAQLITFTAAAAALTYLVTAADAPLVDSALATADRLLGFDWHIWFAWVRMHPMVHMAFVLAYSSSLLQLIACMLFLALWKTADEFMAILILSGLLTIAISGFLPAMGNLPNAPHMPDFNALRTGSMRVIPVGPGSQGLVAFPSFHAALAVIVTYALRGQRMLFGAACLLNFLVILSVPTEGGHYFVDVFGGLAVACAAIWIARVVQGAHAIRNPSSGR